MRASSDRPHRDELIETIRREAGREQGNWTVAFAQAAAERLGLNAPDLGYLTAVLQEEPLSAGRLAELTGLTTGAITGVIDRLERAGFVRRESDPTDRRRVILRTVPERMRESGEVFASSQRAWAEMCARYSDEQLAFIIDFLRGSTAVLKAQTAKLRAEAPPSNDRRRQTGPRGGRSARRP